MIVACSDGANFEILDCSFVNLCMFRPVSPLLRVVFRCLVSVLC